MKKILAVIAGIVIVILIFVAGIFYLTSGIVETADAFFQEVAAGDSGSAWNYLSEEFKASTSTSEFEAFLSKSSLLNCREASWHSRSVTNDSGNLEGKIVTDSGGTVPIKMDFVKEHDRWQIHFIQKLNSGIGGDSSNLTIPTKTEADELVKETTRDFATAINNEDFAEFRSTFASEFQENFTSEQLSQTFSTFIEQKLDLSVLENFQPMFTSEPALSSEGVLQLEGYFLSTPSRTYFSYTYVHRHARWQLLGINVNLKPVED